MRNHQKRPVCLTPLLLKGPTHLFWQVATRLLCCVLSRKYAQTTVLWDSISLRQWGHSSVKPSSIHKRSIKKNFDMAEL
jgi:hypothetical protein